MQYCSLQHQTLLPSPVTSTTGNCFPFGSISSFFLELFLHSSPIAYWAPTDLGSSSFSVLSFVFSYCSCGSQGRNTEVVCHCLLQWKKSMNSMKRQKDTTLKAELSRSVCAQYATGEEWRNNPKKKEETEPKWKQCPVVDVTGDRSKVQCCKEQYCIGTWNVRSTNQGKLEVVKQEWQE